MRFRVVETDAPLARPPKDFQSARCVETHGTATGVALRAQMANTLSTSNLLHRIYAPPQLASVRDADAARTRGRAKLRDQKPNESATTAHREVSPKRSEKP
jgi:hypothetical protein